MTKAELQKHGEKLGGAYSSHLSEPHERLIVGMAYKRAFNQALELLFPLVEALKFECGNRCAEQNPCNAKEALAELEKKVRG
jgi:hypothetical protein